MIRLLVRRKTVERKRDQRIADRLFANLWVTASRDHDILPAIRGPVGHRCRMTARGQGALPELLTVLDIECAEIRVDVPAMNTNPPAVTIGPPRLTEPGGTVADAPPNPCMEPSGTCQRIDSVARSSATSCPHGGGLHGNPDGDTRNCRNIPYGAPACRPYSPSSRRRCGSSNSSRGRRRALVGRLLVFTRSRLRSGSNAYPLHVSPPVFPG